MTGALALIVDDEVDPRVAMRQTLELADIPTATAASVDAALALLGPNWPGAVICDLRMPGRDGFDLLEELGRRDPELPVVILTGHGDVPLAVRAIRMGAYDFLEKPAESRQIVSVASRAIEKRRLVLEIRRLRARLEQGEDVAAARDPLPPPPREPAGVAPADSLAEQVDAFEKQLIEEALCEAKGRLVEVCERLGLPRNTLYDKMRRYGLARGDFAD